MKFRFTIAILAVLQLFTTIGCNSGDKKDDSAANAAMMQQLANAQTQGNVKCREKTSCVMQCQNTYKDNQDFLNRCLDSMTPRQGKATLDASAYATGDLVELCDDNDVCAWTTVEGIEQCWNSGECATTPAPKAKE